MSPRIGIFARKIHPLKMRITLLQTDPAWRAQAANRAAVAALAPQAGGTDLLVLPEMFSTGFVTEPDGAAEEDGESLRFLRQLAAERGYAVAGSVSVRADGAYRNRFYFVKPDGSECHYDKHHLFTYSGEHLRYTAGEERVVVEHAGSRILLQVCYDLRFPVFARNRLVEGRADYDLILYVASWPAARIAAWDTLLHARAIENLCFVAGVNRVGTDPGNTYPGHSVLIGPRGETLAVCKENATDCITTEISLPGLLQFRQSFPALEDADRQ